MVVEYPLHMKLFLTPLIQIEKKIFQKRHFLMKSLIHGHLIFLKQSLSCQVWWPLALWQLRYVFSWQCNLLRPRDQRVEQCYGQRLLKVCHNLAKFGGQKHRSGDVFSLSCDPARPQDQRLEVVQGQPSSCQVGWSQALWQ